MPAVQFINRILESGTVTTASPTVTLTAVNSVNVGDFFVISIRSEARVNSVTDSAGNTYSLASRNFTGATAHVFYTIVTNSITTSTTVTFTLSANATRFSALGASFRNVDRLNPIGSISTGGVASQTVFTAASAVCERYGSMLLFATVNNDGTRANVIGGSVTAVPVTIAFQNWMHVGYRQADSLSNYSVTYQPPVSTLRQWGYVVMEINRDPSDGFAMFGNTAC